MADVQFTSIDELGEFGLIDRLTQGSEIRNASTLMSVGDDCAIVSYPDKSILLSSDMMVSNVHFDLLYTPLQHLGYKAVIQSISDIYAMNGIAEQIIVSVAFSNQFSVEMADLLYEGVKAACKQYEVDLAGGDTTTILNGLVINVTAIGSVAHEMICYRHGAVKNDILCVSGDLGAAYLGLLLLEREKMVYLTDNQMQPILEGHDYILRRQLRPEARKDMVLMLKDIGIKPTSMIDISDGLSSEILHIAKSSNVGVKLFEDKILQDMHEKTLKVLENPGMKIMNADMLTALEKKGASVNHSKMIVSFPCKIIEDTLQMMKDDINNGRIPKYMNGVTSEKTDQLGIQAKFQGACVQYFDWRDKQYREPNENDLIGMVKLGEAIPEIKTVGNPVVYLKDNEGNEIEPRMQRIKTAALVAKYTTKPGTTEVWNAKELEYLIEIGSVVRGSLDDYFKNPCFITAKETIAPLILEDKSAEVLLALAKKGLPCTVIPMPISGVSSPVDPFANIIIGNSEILGVAAAIKAIHPEAKIVGGIISGSMDMATGTANFATPEATIQDLGLSEIHERLYGFNFGMGGYLDAKYPGVQNVIEKCLKYFALALTGRYTYPVGLINWGKCFSPEQALIDVQIIKNIHKYIEEVKIPDLTDTLNLIRKVGIGGSFLSEEDTLLRYKDYLMIPELFDHTLSKGYQEDIKHDSLEKASIKVRAILSRDDLYEIEPEKSREIDNIIKKAEQNL